MPTWLYWLHLKSRNQTDCKHDLQRSLQPFPFPVVGGISILMLRKLGFRKITQMTKVQWQPKTVPRTELRLEAQHKRGSDINLTNTSYYPENDSISALIKVFKTYNCISLNLLLLQSNSRFITEKLFFTAFCEEILKDILGIEPRVLFMLSRNCAIDFYCLGLKNISIHISASYAANTHDPAGWRCRIQARFLVKVEAEGLRLLKTIPQATVTQAPWGGAQTKMQIQKGEQLKSCAWASQAGLPGHLLVTQSPAQGPGSVLLLIITMGT